MPATNIYFVCIRTEASTFRNGSDVIDSCLCNIFLYKRHTVISSTLMAKNVPFCTLMDESDTNELCKVLETFCSSGYRYLIAKQLVQA